MQQSDQQYSGGKVQITMLGEFSIRVGESEMHDSLARTHQLWHLIEYLIAFRHRVVTQEELMEALWPEGDIDNPANALKNLVYRVRSALSSNGLPYAKEMILLSRGCYRWNNDLPTIVDTEVFEERYNAAIAAGQSVKMQVRRYTETIDLYAGNFLPGAKYETWVVNLSSHYRWMYFSSVYALLEILKVQQKYAEMERICTKAIQIDGFEEPAHRYLILSLIRQEKQAQAMAHYSQTTDLFFREMGVSPSSAMRQLYREIAKTTHDVEMDLSLIKEDLEERQHSSGALFCEYEVFKNMYRREARTAARTGQSIFLALITVEDSSGNILDVKLQNKVMDSLYSMVQNSLRLGDVFVRFSASQYILMLSALTWENCDMVMDRIIKRFRTAYRNKDVTIHSQIQPVDPLEAVETEKKTLSEEQRLIPNLVTKTLICVDEKSGWNFSGMIYNPFMPHSIRYENAAHLIAILEKFFNDVDFPQASFADRSFLTKGTETEAKKPGPIQRFGDDGMLDSRRGKLATFLVEVRFRQRGTWQGALQWVEGQQSRRFRSTLELLKYLDDLVIHNATGN